MRKGQFTEEQKIQAIRQMDGGRAGADIGRELGVSKHAIYAWKAKYGDMDVNEARRLKQLGAHRAGTAGAEARSATGSVSPCGISALSHSSFSPSIPPST